MIPIPIGEPRLYCIGYKIDWNGGKNVTLKTVKKKQKHRVQGTVRTVTEDFPKDSFFNFFTPQGINSNGKDGKDDFLPGTIYVLT